MPKIFDTWQLSLLSNDKQDYRLQKGQLTSREPGLAAVRMTPGLDLRFLFQIGAGEHFNATITALAREPGYTELQFVSVVPNGRHNVSDSGGNLAEELNRTVKVVETGPIDIIEIIQPASGMVQLTWTSRAGVGYIVRSCFDLSNGTWHEEATITAEGTFAGWTDLDTAYPVEFYRIEIK